MEEAENQEHLDAIERVEPEVNDLAAQVAGQLNVNLPPPDSSA